MKNEAYIGFLRYNYLNKNKEVLGYKNAEH